MIALATGNEFVEQCRRHRHSELGKKHQDAVPMFQFQLPGLPEKWTWASLSELCERVSVGHVGPTTEFFCEPDRGVPLIRSQDVRPGKLTLGNVAHITPEFHAKLKKSQLQPGDILVVRVGANRGDCCVVPDGTGTVNCANIVFARPMFPNGFLGLFLRSRFGQELLLSITTGAAQGVLNTQTIARLPVPVPPVATQRKIAGVLGAYDELIENNRRRIEILEEMARRLYREWFVQFRFPGHAHVPLTDSPLGKIPKGWEVVKLRDVAAVNRDSITKNNTPTRIRYVDIASVSPGQINKIEEIDFKDAPSRARRIVQHGDTIWSAVRPNRRSFAVILSPQSNVIVSTGFAVLTPQTVPFTFLHEAVTTDAFVSYLANHATGAAYPAVNAGDFELADLLVPPQSLLDRFHQVVEPMFLAKHNFINRLSTLQTTRDLLLPRLISGELDVSELPIEVEEAARDGE